MNRLPAALAALLLALTACTPAAEPAPSPTPAATAAPSAAPTAEPTPTPDDGELDLTTLSSTMVFAEVSAMVRSPGDYLGRTVRMQGSLMVY